MNPFRKFNPIIVLGIIIALGVGLFQWNSYNLAQNNQRQGTKDWLLSHFPIITIGGSLKPELKTEEQKVTREINDSIVQKETIGNDKQEEIDNSVENFDQKAGENDSMNVPETSAGRVIQYLKGKPFVILQQDNRYSRVLFPNESTLLPEDLKAPGYVAGSVIQTATWARYHGYGYLFQSRLEHGGCRGVGIYPKLPPNWCKITSILVAFDLARAAGAKAIIYLDTDAKPNSITLGIENLFESYEKAKVRVPDVIVSTDSGGWSNMLRGNGGVYKEATCAGLFLLRTTTPARRFLHRLFFNSTQWMSPYEVARSKVHVNVHTNKGPIGTNHTLVLPGDLPQIFTVTRIDKPKTKSEDTRAVFEIRLKGKRHFHEEHVNLTGEPGTIRSIHDVLMTRCNDLVLMPDDLKLIKKSCRFLLSSTVERNFPGDMDRTNWMVELHPDEAEPSNKHLTKMGLVFSETPTVGFNARYSLFHHFSGRRKGFLDQQWRTIVEDLRDQTKDRIPRDWWIPSLLQNSTATNNEETPNFEWANEFVRSRIMSYGVPQRIMDKYGWDSILELLSSEKEDVLVASNPEFV